MTITRALVDWAEMRFGGTRNRPILPRGYPSGGHAGDARDDGPVAAYLIVEEAIFAVIVPVRDPATRAARLGGLVAGLRAEYYDGRTQAEAVTIHRAVLAAHLDQTEPNLAGHISHTAQAWRWAANDAYEFDEELEKRVKEAARRVAKRLPLA